MRDMDKTLEEIYEEFEFERSDPGYDADAANRAHKIKQLTDLIERHLQGVINYYHNNKMAAEKNPQDNNSIETLERLEMKLRKENAQFHHFERDIEED